MTAVVEVVVQVVAGGRWHRGFTADDVLFTAEGCNLDDAGTLDVHAALPPDVAHDQLCKRCLAHTPKED